MIDPPDNVVETGHVEDFLTPINYGHYGRLDGDGLNGWHPSFLKLAPTLERANGIRDGDNERSNW